MIDLQKEPEIFKDIPGYEGRYQITNYGRVYSLEYIGPNNSVRGNKFLKPAVADGYHRIKLHKDKVIKSFAIHRLVGKAFIENPNNKPYINHKNFLRNDNFYLNLEWMTAKENTIHAFLNKRYPSRKGELNHSSKITKEQVLEIRRLLLENQVYITDIAKTFKVNRRTIFELKSGKTYTDIN